MSQPDAPELERLTWELGLLNEIAEIVSSSLDTPRVLQRAAERIAAAFGIEPVIVRLRPCPDAEAVVVAAVGVPVELAEAAVFKAVSWKSSIAVPIVAGDEVLGALTMGSLQPGRFGASEERILLTIARQFGVAVSNGRLYERVRRAKTEWERTFDAIDDVIAVFDAACRTVRANTAVATLCGAPLGDMLGRRCCETGLCGGPGPACLVAQAVAEPRSVKREIVRPDGRIFAMSVVPVSEAPVEVLLVGREVTEDRATAQRLHELGQELQFTNRELRTTVDRLRSTQAQLVQAGKLTALGQLVAGVAHELNNPLTSVMGYAQLVQQQLLKRPELTRRAKDLLDDVRHISVESDRAARIVRNLLLFARRQTVARKFHDPAFLCDQVLELRAYDLRLNGIDVVTSMAPDLSPVFVDASQIQQALLNLLLNAEQAMAQSPVRRLELNLTAEPACGSLLIEIRDTGHGIEPANLTRVFDPFFTTREVGEGTGLGLSIVFGIVRDHGGQIWVESRVNEGSSVFVRLPMAEEGADLEPLGCVLVANGDPGLRDFLASAFAGWGFHTVTARTLPDAFSSLSEDDPTVVVVDRAVVEPDPVRWRDVWERRKGRSVMIAVFGSGSDDETERFMRDRARVAISSTVDLCQLRRAMLAATGVRQPRGS